MYADAWRADDIVYEWMDGDQGLMIDDSAKELLRNQGWELVSSAVEAGVSNFATGDYSEGKITLKLRKTP